MRNWRKYLSLVLVLSAIGSSLTPLSTVKAETGNLGEYQTETEGQAEAGEMIRSVDFLDTSDYGLYAKENVMEIREDESGDKYLYMERTNGKDSYVNFNVSADDRTKMAEKGGYVVEYDLCLDEMDESAKLEFYESRDSAYGWKIGYLTGTGALQFNSTSFGNFPKDGAYHRLSLVFDGTNATVTGYVDGVKQGETEFPQDYAPQYLRVSAVTGTGTIKLRLQKFRFYQGMVLRTDEQDASGSEEGGGNQIVGGEIIRSVTFSKNANYGLTAKDNVLEVREDEAGNKYLYMERTNGKDCYVDFSVLDSDRTKMKEKGGYVVEYDLCMDEMDESTKLEFYESKDSSYGWLVGIMDYTGAMTFGKNNTSFGVFPKDGEYHRLSLVFDFEKNTVTCYVDREQQGEIAEFPDDFAAQYFRVSAVSGTGKIILKLDNFRFYQGTVLRTPEQDEAGNQDTEEDILKNFSSVMDQAEDALKLVGENDLVVMVNNGAYLWHKEKKTSDVKSYLQDDSVMIPESIAVECFAAVLEQTTATVADGKNYYSLQELCIKSGKYFAWDDRGFAVASAEEYTLTNSSLVQELDEPSDVLYRYLQFERPDGKKIAEDIIANNEDKAHPRLLTTQTKLDELKENVKTNNDLNAWADEVIENADKYIASGKITYSLENSVPPKLLNTSRNMWTRMLNYALAYEFTEEQKYVDAAWRDLGEVCENYPDWNHYQHFLDTGEMAFAMAIAYDMFYDEFTEEQKTMIREATIQSGFIPGLKAYSGAKDVHGYFVNWHDNCTAVCAGGLMSAAIAMVDEEDTAPYCELLLGQTLQSFENVASLFYPDGAWYEGTNYTEYTVMFMWAGIGSLINATGDDYSILEAPGIDKAPECLIAQHGPAEGGFNYHDGVKGMCLDGAMLWLANYYGIQGYQEKYMSLRETLGKSSYPEAVNLLTYDVAMEDTESEIPLDSFYRTANVGMMSNGSGANGIWAAVHAGENGIAHDHLDLGEFIFEAYGVRWVTDLGYDNYNLTDYFGEAGYNIYRKRPEANNCLIINPREGYQGQELKCSTSLVRMESETGGAIMVFDLSNAYIKDATQVTRGFMFGDDRRSFTIRDEVEDLAEDSELYWFMNLSDEITETVIDNEAKNAIFRTNSGQELKLSFWTDATEYEIGTMACVPLETSPTVEGMADDSTKTKLYIKMKASDTLNLSVKLVPQMGYTGDILPADAVRITDWTVSESNTTERPLASFITLNGKLLDGFKEDEYSYIVAWPMNEDFPKVEAGCDDEEVKVTVTQAQDWKNPALVRLENTTTGKISEYRIVFKMTVDVEGIEGYVDLEVAAIDASDEQNTDIEYHPKEDAFDGDLLTRWSASAEVKPQWIQADLGSVKRFDGIKLSFAYGNQRTTHFAIQISDDGENFETIYLGDSSGNTEGYEVYTIAGTARYIRLEGYYNSKGAWISINEFRPVVKAGGNTGDSENTGNGGNTGESGNTGNSGNAEESGNTGIDGNTEESGNTENNGNAEDNGNAGNNENTGNNNSNVVEGVPTSAVPKQQIAVSTGDSSPIAVSMIALFAAACTIVFARIAENKYCDLKEYGNTKVF